MQCDLSSAAAKPVCSMPLTLQSRGTQAASIYHSCGWLALYKLLTVTSIIKPSANEGIAQPARHELPQLPMECPHDQ
jgi:hypothetical protein